MNLDNVLAVILGVVIVGSCICLAWAVDVLCGTNYLQEIRDCEKVARLRNTR